MFDPAKVDINTLDTVKCKCESEEWEEVVFIKKVPAVLSQSGAAELAFLKGLRCNKCKAPFTGMQKEEEPSSPIDYKGSTID